MVLASHHIDVSESELVEVAQMQEGGLDIEELANLAGRFGLQGEVRELAEADLIQFIGNKQWPIVFLNRFPLDRHFAIHAVIPVRFSRQFVTVLDPRKGEHRISRKRFDRARGYLDRYGVVCKKAND